MRVMSRSVELNELQIEALRVVWNRRCGVAHVRDAVERFTGVRMSGSGITGMVGRWRGQGWEFKKFGTGGRPRQREVGAYERVSGAKYSVAAELEQRRRRVEATGKADKAFAVAVGRRRFRDVVGLVARPFRVMPRPGTEVEGRLFAWEMVG